MKFLTSALNFRWSADPPDPAFASTLGNLAHGPSPTLLRHWSRWHCSGCCDLPSAIMSTVSVFGCSKWCQFKGRESREHVPADS